MDKGAKRHLPAGKHRFPLYIVLGKNLPHAMDFDEEKNQHVGSPENDSINVHEGRQMGSSVVLVSDFRVLWE